MKRRRSLWIGLGAVVLLEFFATAFTASHQSLSSEVRGFASQHALTRIADTHIRWSVDKQRLTVYEFRGELSSSDQKKLENAFVDFLTRHGFKEMGQPRDHADLDVFHMVRERTWHGHDESDDSFAIAGLKTPLGSDPTAPVSVYVASE